MGTFWRASIPGIDAKRSAELKEKIQTQLDADDQLLSTYKKDSALMRFNDSQSLSPWPVSEAMADIVTTSLRIGAKTDGASNIIEMTARNIRFGNKWQTPEEFGSNCTDDYIG